MFKVNTKIKTIVEEGFDNDILEKAEYDVLKQDNVKPGKFYCTFKVHKEYNENGIPPVRPIISGSGSLTENIGIFVDHHLKNLSNKHPTYIKDTPDFLNHIETINNGAPLPTGAVLVTVDVSALYTNIPQEEGIQACREALNVRSDNKVPTDFVIRSLEIILKYNIFEYDQKLYQQLIGTAMGCRPGPSRFSDGEKL